MRNQKLAFRESGQTTKTVDHDSKVRSWQRYECGSVEIQSSTHLTLPEDLREDFPLHELGTEVGMRTLKISSAPFSLPKLPFFIWKPSNTHHFITLTWLGGDSQLDFPYFFTKHIFIRHLSFAQHYTRHWEQYWMRQKWTLSCGMFIQVRKPVIRKP